MIEENINDSSRLWNIISDLASKPKYTNYKFKKHENTFQRHTNPLKIKDNSNIITDPQQIATSFNHLFADIASLISKDLPAYIQNCHDKLTNFVNTRVNIETYFDIPSIESEFVVNKYKHLKTNKAACLDGLPPKLLQIVSPLLT